MYKMSKFFYAAMLALIAVVAGFLISTGTGEGIEYALVFFVAITAGSFAYEKFAKGGTF